MWRDLYEISSIERQLEGLETESRRYRAVIAELKGNKDENSKERIKYMRADIKSNNRKAKLLYAKLKELKSKENLIANINNVNSAIAEREEEYRSKLESEGNDFLSKKERNKIGQGLDKIRGELFDLRVIRDRFQEILENPHQVKMTNEEVKEILALQVSEGLKNKLLVLI